ncbi:MAG: hypothetical protein E7813_21210 [Bradyrhizobium sp.]|uniref:hypothetical protein n=1 Tax=Bradyrhizobium sp. TaxID=376 RepID=UPI0012049946|nr:hypothetical protein [Bradyrhizobium sp.]THD61954.1 MAG: hypothetical protein E7813_21210 [Bradyrhizobium sp.]
MAPEDSGRVELACGVARPISLVEEAAMFKVAVIVFALAVSGLMLWIAHENANFAQLPHAVLVKRAV